MEQERRAKRRSLQGDQRVLKNLAGTQTVRRSVKTQMDHGYTVITRVTTMMDTIIMTDT